LSVATDAYRVGMRAPLSWLREFAPIDGEVAELASVLSQLGLVVEGVHRVGEGLDQVVVARVLSTSPHPKADRVQLVDVDPGDGSTLRVVCGAYNFGPGDLVPLARPGTRLPGGIEIGRRKVRGQWSDGMLCSGVELHLSDDHSGILVLSSAALPGAPLTEALGVTAEVVFDLDITPNRPDALSMAGVARDLAARLGVPFTLPEVPALPTGEPAKATVVVEADDLCPRFIAAQLERIVVGPSPAWMGTRLTLAGMRPINNVVDISNYVMLEMGQPNHPYDLDRLRGGGLSVRRGREGEVVVTLDEVERHVGPDDCLICDAEGAAVGIGGIMGGASSEISEVTTTVLLEAAWFTPMAIARTSKRLGLRTEASGRFERGVDPEATERAVSRFCQLATEVAGATVAGAPVEVQGRLPERARVVVRTARVNAVLGTSLTPDDVVGYLEPIGFSCQASVDGVGNFTVTIPSWRPDSEREIDVIEEVGRHHGYERIAPRSAAASRPINEIAAICARCWWGPGSARPGPRRSWPRATSSALVFPRTQSRSRTLSPSRSRSCGLRCCPASCGPLSPTGPIATQKCRCSRSAMCSCRRPTARRYPPSLSTWPSCSPVDPPPTRPECGPPWSTPWAWSPSPLCPPPHPGCTRPGAPT